MTLFLESRDAEHLIGVYNFILGPGFDDAVAGNVGLKGTKPFETKCIPHFPSFLLQKWTDSENIS